MKCHLSLAIIIMLSINYISMISCFRLEKEINFNRKSNKPEDFQLKTQANDAGKGSIFYLDRHSLQCPVRGSLQGFQLQRNDEKIYYSYTCKNSLAISKSKTENHFTPWNETDNNEENSTNFLDRHTVKCRDSSAIKSVQLIRDGRKISYKYACVKAKLFDCKDEISSETFGGEKKQNYYLDRQSILLPDNRVLIRFTLITRYEGKAVFYKYAYTSCQLEDVESKISALRTAIRDLEQKVNFDHPKKIDEQEKLITSKTEENKKKNSRIEELNKIILDLSTKSATFQKENSTKHSDSNLKNTEKSSLESNQNEISSGINQFKNKILSNSDEISNLEKKNSEISLDIKNAEERKTNILNNINKLKEEISDKEKYINKANDEMNKIKKSIEDKNKEKNDSENRINANNAEISKLTETNEKLRKQNIEAKDLIKKNQTQLEELDTKIKANEIEIEKLHKEISQNQTLINNANTDRNDLINKKKLAEAKLDKKKKKLEFYENF